MPDEIQQFDYHYVIIEDDGARAATIVNALSDSGVNLLAFSEFPVGKGKSQLDLIAESDEDLGQAARQLDLDLSEKKCGFLIRGANRPAAIADTMMSLADAHIRVTAVQSISAGAGRFGAMLWVKPPDVQRASKVLHSAVPLPSTNLRTSTEDEVDEASVATFPASDPPAWTTSPRATEVAS